MVRSVFMGVAVVLAVAGGARQAGAADCYCTDQTGSRVEMGAVICLHVDGRAFLARCEMSLNNPMWRELKTGCLSSEVSPGPLDILESLKQGIAAGRVYSKI
ncbi:hypothetical protein [Amaricoccus tamworthensis]|uniref:hypothetical protein n=1 Tax=Amaricoccus tamworthensis TaxID=57002 RepID=UPI003C7C6F56